MERVFCLGMKGNMRAIQDPDHIMLTPYREHYRPTDEYIAQIAYYWRLVLLSKPKISAIKKELPAEMPAWGKIRIEGGRTTIRTSTVSELSHNFRLSSYYASEYVNEAGNPVDVISYGELNVVLVCSLPDIALFEGYAGKTYLLAIVTPCKTRGKDARKELTSYKAMHAPVAIDMRNIQAVTGRAQRSQQWWILDRFDAAIPTFDELNEKNAPDNASDGEGEAEQEEMDWSD
ncbi:hypothetical protein CC1G_06883 [Coprinopsis cinerea okayama7|uniref:Uncharacterized protein n=1 Tax=Coprinopsis cinerea (strain Okayama-7 / 130 / ATCC MYA-4618 / FGSC 9003) TaxID=240176 RepID=A8N711_COPC7|nr:hypothetical protein CC1G_06883 [Coprinopsis cinerea okayama7\|eukprot:XP_001830617.2 hypothetical protein CC1G_06883 [Coprinopsis cinerea okayama7\